MTKGVNFNGRTYLIDGAGVTPPLDLGYTYWFCATTEMAIEDILYQESGGN